MSFRHAIYHYKLAKYDEMIEYEIFNMTTSTELEANLFAFHLLIDDDELMEYIREGKCYEELASIFNVNRNLMFFKLNEMYRMGCPINRLNVTSNSNFFLYLLFLIYIIIHKSHVAHQLILDDCRPW